MDKLQQYFQILLMETNTEFSRYMHSYINWNGRMICLTGTRGVDKTTLVLRHIKQDLDTSFLYGNLD